MTGTTGTVDVLAVVVTFNSAHVIDDLLDSLPAAMAGLTHATVVVDNGSSDGTADVVAGRADCQVVRAENHGYSAGINRGVAEGPASRTILILNPDLRMHPGSVPHLLKALDVPRTGIAAPRVSRPDGSLDLSLRREPTPLRAAGLNFTGLAVFSEYVTDPRTYERPVVVDWALGAVLLMSRECFEATDGWDESYFLYSEETDLCLRARDLGFLTRYEPSATATHIGGQSGQSPTIHSMQIINRVRLYRRRKGSGAGAWAYFWLTVLSELSWVLRGHRDAATAVTCLLRPARRPPQLRLKAGLMPR